MLYAAIELVRAASHQKHNLVRSPLFRAVEIHAFASAHQSLDLSVFLQRYIRKYFIRFNRNIAAIKISRLPKPANLFWVKNTAGFRSYS